MVGATIASTLFSLHLLYYTIYVYVGAEYRTVKLGTSLTATSARSMNQGMTNMPVYANDDMKTTTQLVSSDKL